MGCADRRIRRCAGAKRGQAIRRWNRRRRRARIVPGVTPPRRSGAQLRVRRGQRRRVGSLRSRVSPHAVPRRRRDRPLGSGARAGRFAVCGTVRISPRLHRPVRSSIVDDTGSRRAAVTCSSIFTVEAAWRRGCGPSWRNVMWTRFGRGRVSSRFPRKTTCRSRGLPPVTSRWSIDRGFWRRFNVPSLPRSRFSPPAIASDSAVTMHSR